MNASTSDAFENSLGDCFEVLIRLSAALASRSDEELESVMRVAAECDADDAIEEVILQSYLFLGYPIALNAMARWRAMSGANPREHAGVERDTWLERGEEVCGVVYGGQYAHLRANVRRLHPDLECWMIEEGYGKVLGRPGLSLQERELCIVAQLVVLDVPRQLHSHLRGALNVGATESAVESALRVGLEYAEPRAQEQSRETWESVRVRSAESVFIDLSKG
jgi:4-carboxymuconolactone decarboxylase